MQSLTARPPYLATFWFGLQAVWGALLGISLQVRSAELHPNQDLLAYGMLAMTGALTGTVTQLIVGPLSDQLRQRGADRRWFFMLGASFGSLGIFGFYLAPTFNLLVASLICLQLALNVAIGPYQAIIPDYVPAQKAGRASAWMAGLQSLGNAAGALTAAIAPKMALPYWCVAAILVFMLLVTCMVTTAHIARLRPLPVRESEPLRITRPRVDLFISRALLWLGFYTMLGYMLFYIRDTLLVRDAATTTGLVILVFTLLGTAGAALVAQPADRYDRRLVVNVCTGVFVVALIGFVVFRNVPLMFAAVAIAGVGWGGFLAADWALGCSVLPPGMMATAMGVWNIAVAAPQVLAPALTSALILATHPMPAAAAPAAFALAVAEVVLGALWVWRIPVNVTQMTQT